MSVHYDKPVTHCNYKVRCIPADNNRQRILKLLYFISPNMTNMEGIDAFGNQYLYGAIDEPHDCFKYFVKGVLESGLEIGEKAEPEAYIAKYRHSYGKNKAGKEITAYFHSLDIDHHESNLAKAINLMNYVYKDFQYVPNKTSVATSAEEAFVLGVGVCQDYAHILIALCHLAGIPAKYVAGMMIGEGSTHAWVDIYDNGIWYGLDPTNNIVITDTHIKISSGRDAMDCQMNRGIILGGGNQTQEVHVLVEEIKNP